MNRSIIITGGAGFIGSHVIRRFVNTYPEYKIINVDKLTYAGNLENISDVSDKPNYFFEHADICDEARMEEIFEKYDVDGVIHLAAESHVDRSITDPLIFVKTNLLGTANLLQVAKKKWSGNFEGKKFHHVSTDEVFGSLEMGNGFFTEETAYDPRSPYSASKAGSDHLIKAFYHTYHFPAVLTNCSNNYGPNHFPEKLIPLMINNILHNKPLPVYGKGENVRDWLHVKDHARAIDVVFHHGRAGETYNVGGHNEWKNIDLVYLLCDLMDEKLGRTPGTNRQLITYVTDRAGHDLRYAIDAGKIERELAWVPDYTFEEGLAETVDWYLANETWLKNVTTGAYRDYYEAHYKST